MYGYLKFIRSYIRITLTEMNTCTYIKEIDPL